MKLLMESWRQYLSEAQGEPFWKGYLGWEVPSNAVDTFGIEEKYIQNKITRDGADGFHITIITPPEVRGIISAIKEKEGLSGGQAKKVTKQKLLEEVEELQKTDYIIGDTKTVEGLGDGAVGTKDQPSVAFFKVIDWPNAQDLRKKYGLGFKDFHITVGIGDNGDVHGVEKK